MTASHRFTIATLALLAAIGITLGAAWIGYTSARAADYLVDATDHVGATAPLVIAQADAPAVHPYRDTMIAQADTGGDGSAALPPVASDGSGSATATSSPTTAAPADKLHDPIASPGAAWDDIKAAKKTGWAVLLFASLVMLAKLAGRAKKYKLLAALGKGKTAVLVGAVGALAAACYNAAAEGGAWTAMMATGLVAIGHYLDASGKEPNDGSSAS